MKIAFKNFLMTLRRYKVASLLNIVGLTLAFVAFYIIFSQVWYTITYNGQFPNADRIYLISPDFGGGNDGEIQWSTNSPGNLAYVAAEQFPDAEEVASTMPYPRISRIWIKRNEYTVEPFNEYVYQGTANVPSFFGFECLAGDFSQLKEPNTVAMARSKAEKLGVGVGDVIYFEGGKYNDDGKPTVQQSIVAIYEDMPKNSMFSHWGIMQNDEGVYTEGNNNWNYSNFVRMREDADLDTYIEIFKKGYADWFLGMVQEWMAEVEDPEEKAMAQEELDSGAQVLATRLVSLDELYYAEFYDSGNFQTGKKHTPIILGSIAFIIVLIAFINFVNFFFALVPVRMRAVNICKVFGASQGTLRWNFLFEAIGLVLLSMGLTFYLMIAIQESFITNYSICSLALGDNIAVIIMMVALMVLLAVVAALYPAFYITRFNASLGVKGGFAQSATGRRLRSVMVGVQFSVAMILIIVTAVFGLQYRFMINYDLGFDRENIVTFASWDLGTRSETVVERLQQHPDAVDVTSSAVNLFHCNQMWGRMYKDKEYRVRANPVRWNFLDFFGFEVIEGQGFTQSSAERDEIVMMSRMHRDVGIPLGYKEGNQFTYVGIIKDIRLTSLAQEDEYYAFYCDKSDLRMSHFYIRLRAGADVEAFADYVKRLTKELAPAAEEPELYYLEEWVEGLYAQTKKDMVLIGLFAGLAIIIALMGVFGIVMFETQHRRSEIAVRKVYGATTRQIVEMLNLRYVWIVGGCFVVAAPVAWQITSRWLEQFANRIAQPWWLYIAALLVVLAVTVGLVTLRSWRAATENPADVVKSN